MEVKKENITVVLQGPIDDRTYEAIDSYNEQGFGEVIVSTWADENIDLLLPSDNQSFKLVTSKYPDMTGVNNDGCRFFVAITTGVGCHHATKDFVLKVRTDEFYPDLSKFIENWQKYPNRAHTTNNGFWKFIPFNFSNHIYLCKKEILFEACSSIVHHSSGRVLQNVELTSSEQATGYFIMLAMGHDLSQSDWRKVFSENVFITPCSDLPGHLHSGQSFTNFKFKRVPDYPNNRKDSAVLKHCTESIFNHHKEFLL